MTEKMKPSGIAWIGDVPESWKICRIKDLCTIARGGSPRPIDEYLSDNPSDINWIRIGDTTKGNKYITQTEQKIIKQGISSSRMVYDGDLLLTNSMSFGQPYIMKTCGCIHDGWLVFSDYHRIDKLFLYYVLMSELCLVQFKTSVAGAVVENLSIDKVGISKIFLPSLEEQGAIVNFLDTQCTKIDSVIADIEKQIEILQKYKKSLITETVTKGLDQSVPMKDSGCKWVSHIPVHWSIKRFKYLLNYITDGSHFSPETVDEGCPYITAADVRGLGLDYQAAKKISNQDFIALQRTGCQPKVGDVLLVKDGATTGRIGMVTSDYPCVVLSSVAILRAPESMDCRYLRYLMESEFVQAQIQASMAGSAMPRTVLSKIVNYLGMECPKDEQIRICDYLDKKCSSIDGIILQKEKQLEAITQHKKSLIYEYVTGKKRVTEVN